MKLLDVTMAGSEWVAVVIFLLCDTMYLIMKVTFLVSVGKRDALCKVGSRSYFLHKF